MCSRSGAGQRERRVGGALSRGLPLCLALALLLVGCATTGGATSAPAPTRTSASRGSTGWSTYHDPTYGFVVVYPSDATLLEATTTGATSLARWRIANPQGGGDDAILEVSATTQASAGICAHASDGAPVTLAGGVTGHEQDTLSDTTPASAASQPQLAVIVLHGGLLTILTLTGQGQSATFMQRWGGVWAHILAAFQSGQGPAGAQPCG